MYWTQVSESKKQIQETVSFCGEKSWIVDVFYRRFYKKIAPDTRPEARKVLMVREGRRLASLRVTRIKTNTPRPVRDSSP